MSSAFDRWDCGEVARRWRVLAERRRQHLIELYKSGRWRRYYTEEEFLHCVRQAAREVESWDALAGPEISMFRKAS